MARRTIGNLNRHRQLIINGDDFGFFSGVNHAVIWLIRCFTEQIFGLLQTGRMAEASLLHLIPQIPANLVTIYSHPAISLPTKPDIGIGFR